MHRLADNREIDFGGSWFPVRLENCDGGERLDPPEPMLIY